jgi:threonine dehydratase
MQPIQPASIDAIRAAQKRIAPLVVRTPLVRLGTQWDANGGPEIWLKLENLQPIGSFKLRAAASAMLRLDRAALQAGVWTASAGNMAQGVAWCARQLGIPARVVVPDNAPETKLAAAKRLGAEIVRVPFATWWDAICTGQFGDLGRCIHPVCDPDVVAGNGTIGLELLEDLPDVDSVVIPYGGGGLSTGIASALRALRPQARVFACEVETAAPLAASLRADAPAQIEHTPSFVDGIGGRSVLPEMWPAVRQLIGESIVVPVREVADAIRLLVERNRVVAEGAGAASVAAARSGRAGSGKIACIVSGGNIDSSVLAGILDGRIPAAPSATDKRS